MKQELYYLKKEKKVTLTEKKSELNFNSKDLSNTICIYSKDKSGCSKNNCKFKHPPYTKIFWELYDKHLCFICESDSHSAWDCNNWDNKSDDDKKLITIMARHLNYKKKFFCKNRECAGPSNGKCFYPHSKN